MGIERDAKTGELTLVYRDAGRRGGGDPEPTWTCHACGEPRPDRLIAVHTNRRAVRGVSVSTNVRYCTDRPECAWRAAAIGLGWMERL